MTCMDHQGSVCFVTTRKANIFLVESVYTYPIFSWSKKVQVILPTPSCIPASCSSSFVMTFCFGFPLPFIPVFSAVKNDLNFLDKSRPKYLNWM